MLTSYVTWSLLNSEYHVEILFSPICTKSGVGWELGINLSMAGQSFILTHSLLDLKTEKKVQKAMNKEKGIDPKRRDKTSSKKKTRI